MQKSMDGDAIEEAIDFTLRKAVDEEEEISMIITKEVEVHKQDDEIEIAENPEKIYVAENGLFMLPKDHPDHLTLIKLQLENQVSFKAFLLHNISCFYYSGTNELETAITNEN